MKQPIALAAAVVGGLALALGPAVPPAQAYDAPERRETSTRFLTYNIKSGAKASLAAIARDIRQTGAVVVGLQEVKDLSGTGGRQAAIIAGHLGWKHWRFGGNAPVRGGRLGNAVISKYPIVHSVNKHLRTPEGRQQRGLLRTWIKIDGHVVSFNVTHLEHQRQQTKNDQAQHIRQILGRRQCSTVLVGDFNAGPGSRVHRVVRADNLADLWLRKGRGDGGTSGGGARIDYIFFDLGSKPVNTWVAATHTSDHKGLVGVLRFNRNRACPTPG
jgi:endonuclease/exonuclease/phosphatase family metal-dependent hydrolase